MHPLSALHEVFELLRSGHLGILADFEEVLEHLHDVVALVVEHAVALEEELLLHHVIEVLHFGRVDLV